MDQDVPKGQAKHKGFQPIFGARSKHENEIALTLLPFEKRYNVNKELKRGRVTLASIKGISVHCGGCNGQREKTEAHLREEARKSTSWCFS